MRLFPWRHWLAKQKLTEKGKKDIGGSVCKQATGTTHWKCIMHICHGSRGLQSFWKALLHLKPFFLGSVTPKAFDYTAKWDNKETYIQITIHKDDDEANYFCGILAFPWAIILHSSMKDPKQYKTGSKNFGCLVQNHTFKERPCHW